MRTSSLLYLLASALAVAVAALRISHVMEKSGSYILIAVAMALGIWGNELRRREIKKGQQ
ncbi:hypothetical protein GCM10011405_11970 [Rufibacter glacialis]|nr:hypothetical protein GCM10011405_11970 [Rufibacter glacialis]